MANPNMTQQQRNTATQKAYARAQAILMYLHKDEFDAIYADEKEKLGISSLRANGYAAKVAAEEYE
jgi:hypothetical protein